MKKRNKFSIPPKYFLIFLTVICTGLIVLSLLNTNRFIPVQNAVSKVLVPVQKGLNQVGLWFYDKAESLKEISKLQEENENLQEEIDNLKSENIIMLQWKGELDRLRELYKLDNIYEDYPKVAARVIGANPGNWFSEFKIDKGSEDGLAVDMNVIAGSGLVGRISYVGENYAIVSTIINDGHMVSARFADSPNNCFISGDLKHMEQGLMKVSDIDKDADVVEGTMVVTSFISDKYVPGILIGYITEVKDDSNNLTKSGYVSPVVDFSSIEEVLVITQLKITGEE